MALSKERKIVVTHEVLAVMKEELYNELRNSLMFEINDAIIRRISEKMGMILDFPLTVKQVANLTGRTEHNIYKMCERGKIPFVKNGATIHINLRDLNSALIKI